MKPYSIQLNIIKYTLGLPILILMSIATPILVVGHRDILGCLFEIWAPYK